MTQLKVGDKIYQVRNGVIRSIKTVERVTKTQAFTSAFKFKIDVSSWGAVTPIPYDRRDMHSYCLETPELIHTFKLQQLRESAADKAKAISAKVAKMELSELEKALELLNQIIPDQP